MIEVSTGEMTLKRIAEAAGVSRSTVSRALKNNPRIGRDTIARIQNLAKEMGYQRDADLTQLMTRLRHRKAIVDRPVIAFLLWQHIAFDPQIHLTPHTIYHGLWNRAVECGYQPEFFNLAEFDGNRNRISQILRSRGIRGGILCPAERPAPLPAIPWDELCIVAIGYSLFSQHLHRCATNHYQGMLDSIEHLQKLGYRKIGAVFSPAVSDRSYGYYHAAYLLSEATMEHERLAPFLICPPGGEAVFYSWLDTAKPEVIICGGIRHHVSKWLDKRGLRVPEDIGLADLQIQHPDPASGISQNASESGASAIDLLTTLLENNEMGLPKIARTVIVNGHWVEGNTTRRIPQGLTAH